MLNVPVIFDEKKQISSSLVLEMVTKGIHGIGNGLLSICLYGYFLLFSSRFVGHCHGVPQRRHDTK